MRVDLPVPLSPAGRCARPPPPPGPPGEQGALAEGFGQPLDGEHLIPRNSRSPKRTSIFRSRVGLSVVRIRSMRFSMDWARLKILSLPE